MLLFIHLLAAAFWLGGLMLLPMVVVAGLRTLDRASFQSLIRLTGKAFAVGSILAWTMLGITGYLLARQRLGSLADLNSTAFGHRLSLKLLFAGGALLAAVLHTAISRTSGQARLIVSRVLAAAAFLMTLGVFYEAARLSA